MPRTDWLVRYDADADRGSIAFNDPKDGTGPVPPVVQEIQFQHGPIGENGINGIQNEEVIELLIMRIRALDLRTPCMENAVAITRLEDSLSVLNRRTEKRQAQGVEGTERPHSDTEVRISE